MSSPKLKLKVTRQARRDIRSIELYTFHQWGLEKANAYKLQIEKVFELLKDNPRIGRSSAEAGVGVFRFPVEHHILFYRVKDDTIEIVRILHERADAERHLPEQSWPPEGR